MNEPPAEAVYGSDVIVELLERADVEFVACTPGATFRGIHDSLVHRQSAPELVVTPTEGLSVAVAHGYAKATGRPMAVAVHDIVGLQQACMAIFNAWCDRVPMLVLGATGPVSKAARRPWIDWIHTASVQGQLVRDYVKWDDQPAALVDVPESIARAITTATSAPKGPVYVCFDVDVQEQEAAGAELADAIAQLYPAPSDPAPADAELQIVADLCRGAQLPVIVTDYAGDTEAGFRSLQALAERLHAPVVDRGARFSFPTDHPLAFAGVDDIMAEADLVIAIDVDDLFAALVGPVLEVDGPVVRRRHGVSVVHFTTAHYRLRSWSHDYGRLVPVDLTVSASAEQAIAGLLRTVAEPPAEVADARRMRTAGRVAAARRRWRLLAASDSTNDGAITRARLAAELGDALRDDPWVLANGSLDGWERRLWDFRRHRQHLGWHGGAGLGYGLGASIGAALALADEAVCVDIQPDGDLLFQISGLWTLAHRRLPLLVVLDNNRQYRNSVDHAVRVAAARGRDERSRYVGTSLTDPDIDYATVARGFGVWAAGPVTSATALKAVLEEAVEVVRDGRPAVVDVVTAGS